MNRARPPFPQTYSIDLQRKHKQGQTTILKWTKIVFNCQHDQTNGAQMGPKRCQWVAKMAFDLPCWWCQNSV